jgi:hypothetical protein
MSTGEATRLRGSRAAPADRRERLVDLRGRVNGQLLGVLQHIGHGLISPFQDRELCSC